MNFQATKNMWSEISFTLINNSLLHPLKKMNDNPPMTCLTTKIDFLCGKIITLSDKSWNEKGGVREMHARGLDP